VNVAHLGFILASYIIAIAAIGGLAGGIWLEYRRLQRELAQYSDAQRERDGAP
jgi:heme exporter protein CcmD